MRSAGVHRAGIASLVGACSALCATHATAQDAEAVHLTYDAPAGCPNEGDFLDMVARDGGRFVWAPDAQEARSFAVHIEGTLTIAGRLVVREGDGTEAAREMSGVRCDDVVRSLAVLVALSVEPPGPTAAAPPSSAPPVPGFAASNLGPEREPGPPDPGLEPVVLRPHQGWRLDVSLEGTLNKVSSPSNNPSLAAYVEIMKETPRFFAPSIRVGAEIAASQTLDLTTTFRRFVGRLDACPWRGVFTRPWSDDAFTMQACGRVDVGRIEAEAYANFRPPSTLVRRLWIAPAVILRFRWTSPGFFLEAEAGATFPLLRERFHVESDAGVFEIPPVALTTGLGVGWFLL